MNTVTYQKIPLSFGPGTVNSWGYVFDELQTYYSK